MAENGNRGPNDFRARNGRRRREPPIIDASATEVPLAAEAPAAAGAAAAGVADAAPLPAAEPRADEADTSSATSSHPSADGPSSPDTSEPVLFGSAIREPAVKPESGTTPAEVPAAAADDADHPSTASEAPGPDAAATPVAAVPDAAAPAPATSAEATPAPAAPAPSGRPGASVPPHMASEPRRAGGGGAAAWLLTLSTLALLGALAWVLFTEPQRNGRTEIADLRARIAALEARPDPVQVQGSVGTLDKRVEAAEADRAALARTVSDLTTRLDAVAQQAQATQTDAAKAADQPAPTGTAAAATVGALAALAAEVAGVDSRMNALSAAQGQTAKAVADLPKPVAPDFSPVEAKLATLDGRVAAIDGRLTALDGKSNGVDAHLNAFDAKVNAVDSKINGFDARMNAFENRANGISAKLDDAVGGLGKLQGTVADLPHVDLTPLQAATTALDGRVATIDGHVATIDGRVAGVDGRVAGIDGRVAAIDGRVATVDGRVGGIEGQLSPAKDGARVTEARAVGSADETRATPIALVGQAVVRAVAEGRPYAADLDALKGLGADSEALAKLSPLAAEGVPTAVLLRDRWTAVQGDVVAAAKPAEGGNALQRFAAGARGLVQVRRIGAVQGEDPAALASQVDAALSSGDVPGALAAWTKLPQAGRDRSQDWAAAAQSHVDAADAAQGLVGRAIASLGKTKS